MAESNAQPEEIGGGEKLKYLDFVHVAAMQAVMCFASLYGLAKENSGPLRPGVETVEGAVKAVVGPVYEKLHDAPLDVLRFVDRKVDDVVHEAERHVPSVIKEVSSKTYSAAQKAPEVAQSIAGEVHRSGVVPTVAGLAKAAYAKYEPVAKEAYAKYEPVAERYVVATWRWLNRLPLFPQVAEIVVPTAAYWVERYNKAAGSAAERGYTVAEYLPLVPTERIAKVFGSGEENANGKGSTKEKAVPDDAAEEGATAEEAAGTEETATAAGTD